MEMKRYTLTRHQKKAVKNRWILAYVLYILHTTTPSNRTADVTRLSVFLYLCEFKYPQTRIKTFLIFIPYRKKSEYIRCKACYGMA